MVTQFNFAAAIRGSLLLVLLASLSACSGFCISDLCFGMGMDVSERDYDLMNDEFRLAGENSYGDVSMVYELQSHETIEALSFGIEKGAAFAQYGVARSVLTLSDQSLKTYREEYVIPAKHCPASFMNQNLKALMLVGANEAIDEELQDFELEFDSLGTPFSISGHVMKHLPDRYSENGKPLHLTIPQYISISSNVGSASRAVTYFLVTEIGVPEQFAEFME